MNIRSLTLSILLCIAFNTVSAQSDPLYIDKDGNVYIRVKGINKKLTVEGYAEFVDSIAVNNITLNALRAKKQLSVTGNTVFSDSVRMLRPLVVTGNTNLNGNVGIGSTTQRSDLDVSGNMKVGGTVTLTTNTQASNLDVNGQLKITSGAPGPGKTLTSDASGVASWQKGARRDFRPYGNPSYYWDGQNCEDARSTLEVRGSASISNEFCSQKWGGGNRVMFKLQGLSPNSSASPPQNGIYITLPATPNVHNNLLISTIDADRWSVWSVWLCDANKTPVIKLAVSANNANGGTYASTYTLGPFNNPKETSIHGWMVFPVIAADVTRYIKDGKLRFLVTSGPSNSDGTLLFMSGLALVPNPNGFMQQPSLVFHYGLNGETYNDVKWGGLVNNDGNAQVSAISTATLYIKVIDPDKDLLVTFHEINGDWIGGSLNVTVGNDATVYRPSTGIIGMSSTLYSSFLRMRPESIIIPATVVKQQLKPTSPSGVQNVIMLKVQNTGNVYYGFHGIDTEIY